MVYKFAEVPLSGKIIGFSPAFAEATAGGALPILVGSYSF